MVAATAVVVVAVAFRDWTGDRTETSTPTWMVIVETAWLRLGGLRSRWLRSSWLSSGQVDCQLLTIYLLTYLPTYLIYSDDTHSTAQPKPC